MTIDFVKISPSGNTTVLVLSPVDRRLRAQVAAKLMRNDMASCEQVGFLETPADPKSDIRLEMMGGEFCANASAATAAYLARLGGGDKSAYTIEVSGCLSPLAVSVSKDGHGFVSRAPMPLPATLGHIDIRGMKAPLVALPGISHAILPLSESGGFTNCDIREIAKGVEAEAFGLMFYFGGEMRPFVYVKSTDTAVWESACGSGTAAVAVWTALESGITRVEISQPGGVVAAEATARDGIITSLAVSVKSLITLEGKAYINLIS